MFFKRVDWYLCSSPVPPSKERPAKRNEFAHLPILKVFQPVDKHIKIYSIRRIEIVLVVESFLRLLGVEWLVKGILYSSVPSLI